MKYEVKGEYFPYVECLLETGESVFCPDGAPSLMTPNMVRNMAGGFGGKLFSKPFSGNTASLNKFTAVGREGRITFASGSPGEIRVIDVSSEKEVLVQKEAILAMADTVTVSVALRKKKGNGYFGIEGMTFVRLAGEGPVFIRVEGCSIQREMEENEEYLVDAGYLLAYDKSCTVKVIGSGTIKDSVFGQKSPLHFLVKGPGIMVTQSMPICQSTARMHPHLVGFTRG